MTDNAIKEEKGFSFTRKDSSLILAFLGVSFVALLLGAVAGLLQVLERGGYISLQPQWYYLLLTLHGVALALIFTTYFIIGFLYSGVIKTLGGKMHDADRRTGWIGFWMMTIGIILALFAIANQSSSVLYTFYAPMKASPWFYVGLALVVVGSWVGGTPIFSSYAKWRKANKGQPSPLFAFMAVATFVLWVIATLGVAIEVVFQLIPWSFGWVSDIDVSLSRTLFWYFGHPLVYFWLLPAYIYWYVNIPAVVKGRLFSDSLPRLTFILFILYSIPVGFHHQLMEPGITSFWKFLQVILTMLVVVPSLMTVFAILATFEIAGRMQGAKGRFGWVKKLPWNDVRFLVPFFSMVMFIPAGAGGVISASYQLDQVVHNTLFITGHFHMTLATTVVLTFFGISYWLIPLLTGRTLTRFANNLGIVQGVVWLLGIFLMSVPMHIVGVLGAPRRSAFSTYAGHPVVQEWKPYLLSAGVGGTLLFIGILLYLWVVLYLMFFSPKAEKPMPYPIGRVDPKYQKPPLFLERWPVWIGLTFALILIAYLWPVLQMIQHAPPGSPPIRTW
ncbi:cbb3-type cytochrome c oxidase subunit I [Cohnella algarum]|uniref:cbb3-type cytochrome c oxidase subunit I n=1 Tax=Cohnella algarum TaxID=2044859 RepID=UPI0019689F66|nr:cbb3-type cytochrome c oxidase subunit I [Cohnella algarum]MBN2982265.1 cbb3-type cytochrome c oxidase subunit I [Cohnella algarum]